MKRDLLRACFACANVLAVPALLWADPDITLEGEYAEDKVISCTSDTNVRLNQVSFHDCQLKLSGNVTYTLELVDGTVNDFLIDGVAANVNCAAIKATQQSNIVIDGTGKLKLQASKKMSGDGGILVCSNLTVRSGSVSVTYDKDKSDSPCMLVKGNYLQTGGKVTVDLKKKNCTNEFYGVKLDTKDSSFVLEGGEFNAEIAGTKSRAIDLKKSCTATFRGGDCTALFEGPQGRFVSGGTIVIEGGNFNFSTNITAKLTVPYYPTNCLAVKADYSVLVSGGDFEADLPLVGSEIFTNDAVTGEDVVISGGTFDLVSGNDCIHARGDVIISGGRIRAVSTCDDAIDANGSLTISGGDIRAYATSTNTHGLDVNNGKVDGVKKTLTILGGTVIATDGPNTVKIGTRDSSEVGNVDFRQPTYYGKISRAADFSQKYLVLEGVTNGVKFVVKPCLPLLATGDFNLLVSVPGRTPSLPTAKTLLEAYADRSTACPLVFEKKSRVSGQTVTTKEGAVMTLPDYYDLDPVEGKSKVVSLSLNTNAVPKITSFSVGTGVSVGCPTISGLHYQLQSKTSMDRDWTVSGSKVAGNGQEKTFSAGKTGKQGFYSVTVTDIAD